MASYKRLGSFFLAEVLAANPGGEVVRAISATGGAFSRHHLLRTFSEDLLEAGLGSRWGEARRQASLLVGARGLGANYRFEGGKPACVVCDYVPGRTLATVLEKTRAEGIPLGVDHALTVLQTMTSAILVMHDKNIHHGSLSPNSVWVGFEGATQILDAPFGAIVQGLLPKAPALQAALAPYRAAAAANAFQQDLFALGAMFYELLTLERLPGGGQIPGALAGATLKAAQDEAPIPEEVLGLLRRLLLVEPPFATSAELNSTLERVLYDGDYSPTTFNMAFLMHTLFRNEVEADAQAMKSDQGATFAPPAPAEAAAHKPAREPGRTGNVLLAGGVVAALCGVAGMFFLYQQSNRQHQLDQRSLQARLAAFQHEKEANDARLAEIARQEEAQRTLDEVFGKPAQEGSRVGDAPAGVTRRQSPQPPPGGREALPASLRQADLKVSLRVFVDAAGRPAKAEILKGVEGNFGYDDAARAAALASSYVPATRGGKPAAGWVTLEFDFGKPK